jgi:hypothetical protein
MATGFTYQLEELNYDVKKWLKEKLIRGIGVCASLRDDGHMDEKQLLKALSRSDEYDDAKHRQKQLDEAQDKFEHVQKRTEEQWQKMYTASLKEAQKDYDKRFKEWTVKKANHEKALAEVNALLDKVKEKSDDSVCWGTLRFAKEQLSTVIEHDYTRLYREQILDETFSEWKKAELDGAKRDIVYYAQELKKAKTYPDRAKLYKEFIDFIDQA